MTDQDVNENLMDTSITWDMIEEDMQKEWNTKAITGNLRSVRHLGDHNGFMAKCGLIVFDWQEDSHRLPPYGIIKITGKERFEALAQNIQAYENVIEPAAAFNDAEFTFYKWMHLLDDKPNINVPGYIGGCKFGQHGVDAGYVIIEKIENFHNFHIFHNMDEYAVLDGLKMLARLAAYSLRHPENAEKLAGTKIFETHFSQFVTTQKALMNLDILAKRFQDKANVIEIIKAIAPIFESNKTFKTEMLEGIETPMIVHGDVWQHNMLWKQEASDLFSVKKIVDWQIVHLGNSIEDVTRYTMKALSASEYHKKRDFYLNAYYNTLVAESKGVEIPWKNFDAFIANYEKIFPLIFTVWTAPFIRLLPDEYIRGGDDAAAQERLRNFNEKMRGMIDEAALCVLKQRRHLICENGNNL